MALNKYKLFQLIEKSELKNSDLFFGSDSVRGISVNKSFSETKADAENIDLSSFKIVKPGYFAFNTATSRNGEKISIAYNNGKETIIVSSLYDVFYLNDFGKKVLNEWYLFMFFNRSEFDRYARMDSWGSAREYFRFSNMCDVEIELPDKQTQEKYVNIYLSLIENQKIYERDLNNIKLVYDAFLDQLKHKNNLVPIGNYIEQISNKNVDNKPYRFAGLSMENYFIDSIADANELDFAGYKIVKPGEYGAVLMKVGRDCRLTIARNTSDECYLISPAYFTFITYNINPDYFMANMNRREFERRAWFSCDASARGSLSWDEFLELKIPFADEKEQKIVANLYQSQMLRTVINDRLKDMLIKACPLLIKGSIEEARGR